MYTELYWYSTREADRRRERRVSMSLVFVTRERQSVVLYSYSVSCTGAGTQSSSQPEKPTQPTTGPRGSECVQRPQPLSNLCLLLLARCRGPCTGGSPTSGSQQWTQWPSESRAQTRRPHQTGCASHSGHSIVHCWWLGRSPPEKQSGVSPVHVLSPFGGVCFAIKLAARE